LHLAAWQSNFALRDTETDVVSGPDLKSDAIQSRVEKQQWRMGPCPGVIDEDPGVDIHREERRILCTTWHWKWKGSRWRVIKSGKEKALKRWLQRGSMIRGFSGSCNTGWRRVDVEDRRKAALNFSMVKRPCERRHHRSNGRLSLSRYQAICRF